MGFATTKNGVWTRNYASRIENLPPLAEGETVVETEWDAVNDRPVGVTMPEPEVIIPDEVSPTQIRKWLILQNVTLSQVDDFIATISDPTDREIARVDWEYGLTVRRSAPLVAQFASVLGLTTQQMDAAFLVASEL